MAARTRAARHEHGAAAVEFALVLVLLLTLLFGIIQYGFYFYSASTGSAAAREALRRASVGDCTDAELTAYVEDRLEGASAGGLSVTRTFKQSEPPYTAAAAPGVVGDIVTVRVEFDSHNLNFPFVPFLSDPAIVREVDARLEDVTGSGGCGA